MTRWLLLIPLFFFGCRCPPYPACQTYETVVPIAIAYEEAKEEGAIIDGLSQDEVWWDAFNDCQLENLMSHALALNPKISTLESKVREAYANVKVAKSRLYPRIDLLDDFQFTQITRTGEFPTNIPGFPFEFGLWTLQMNLYYDLDIWDKNKDRVQRYLGMQRSNYLDYEWGKLVLCLNVAENYFKWLIRCEMVEIQKEVVLKQKEIYDLIVKSLQHNIGNELDLLGQKVNVERAYEDLNDLILQQEMYEHAVKALVGNFCEPLQAVPIHLEKLIPFNLPKCLTLDLIGRRPDIQSKIWLIESARKKIDVARKEFYPDLDLTAFFGFSTINFNQWFNSASTNWLINPALHLPIFHGGELAGNLLIAKEEYLQEISDYNQLILTATEEILNAFSTIRLSENNLKRSEEEVALVEKDVYLQGLRVEHNLDPVNLLIQKEIGLYATQLRQKQIEEKILGSILDLIRATGG